MRSRLAAAARLAAGPLALAGFFLPWTEGPGALASVNFSGYELAGYSGRLMALELGLTWTAALITFRALIVGVAVTAALNALLSPAFRWHPAHTISGWYLVVAAPASFVFCLALSGDLVVRPGVLLLIAGALAYASGEVLGQPRLPGREPGAHLVEQSR